MEQMAEVMAQMAEMIRTNQQIHQQMIRMAERPQNVLNPNPREKLQHYNEGDDMETFLETFEASMKVNKITLVSTIKSHNYGGKQLPK